MYGTRESLPGRSSVVFLVWGLDWTLPEGILFGAMGVLDAILGGLGETFFALLSFAAFCASKR